MVFTNVAIQLPSYFFDLRMRVHQMRLYSRPYKCKIAAFVLPFCTSVTTSDYETYIYSFIQIAFGFTIFPLGVSVHLESQMLSSVSGI